MYGQHFGAGSGKIGTRLNKTLGLGWAFNVSRHELALQLDISCGHAYLRDQPLLCGSAFTVGDRVEERVAGVCA